MFFTSVNRLARTLPAVPAESKLVADVDEALLNSHEPPTIMKSYSAEREFKEDVRPHETADTQRESVRTQARSSRDIGVGGW
jgi:hypothetical protein